MSYEPPPQRPSFNPPPDPGYAAPDYDQRQAGQPWAQQPYAQQQPPYYPPPQQQHYPPQQQFYPPQQPPKKKRHWVRNTFLGLAGFIVLIVIISVAANGGSNGTPAAGSGAAPANAAPAAPQVAKIGTPVRDGKFQFTITSVSHAKSVGDTADGFGDTAQGKYTILHVTVTNIGSQPQTLDDSSQYVLRCQRPEIRREHERGHGPQQRQRVGQRVFQRHQPGQHGTRGAGIRHARGAESGEGRTARFGVLWRCHR